MDEPKDNRKKSGGTTWRTNVLLGGSKEKERDKEKDKDRDKEQTLQRKNNPLYAVRELPARQPPTLTVSTAAADGNDDKKRETVNPAYGMSTLRGVRRLEVVDMSSDSDNVEIAPKQRTRLCTGPSKAGVIRQPEELGSGREAKPGDTPPRARAPLRKSGSPTPHSTARGLTRYNSEKKLNNNDVAAAAGNEREERAKLIKKLRSEIQQQQRYEQERARMSSAIDALILSIFGEEDKNGDRAWARMGVRRHVDQSVGGGAALDHGMPGMPAAAEGMVDDILDGLLGKRDNLEPADTTGGWAGLRLVPVRPPGWLTAGGGEDDDVGFTGGGKFGWLDLARAGKEARDRTSTVDYMVDDMIFGAIAVTQPPAAQTQYLALPAPSSPTVRPKSLSAWERSYPSLAVAASMNRATSERSILNTSDLRTEEHLVDHEVTSPTSASTTHAPTVVLADDNNSSSLVFEGPRAMPPSPPRPGSPSAQPPPTSAGSPASEFLAGFNPELRSLPHHILVAIRSQQELRGLKLDEDGAGSGAGRRRRENKSVATNGQVRRTKSERFLSSWDYSAQQIYKTNSGFVSTLVSGPVLEERPRDEAALEVVQEIATAHSAVAVSSLSMGRHRRSPVVRDAAITRRTSHSSTIFAAAGQMAGASSASSASARCPSFIYGSSYTDSSSLASSFADSSSAGFLSSCSSTYNHTLSLGSRTSSFSTTDLSDSETPSTDLLSEANIDSCLSETADSVDNSEASDDDAEPDEEDDDGEPYNDDNGVRGASLRLPQHQWYAREIIGAGSGIGRGGGGYKKNTHKDEQELSPEEQALLADFQRQLDDFLQKRVTEVKYVDRAPVSGTVDGLVAALFHDDDAMDPLYVDLFLAAHRYFIGPRDLLARLQDMYVRVPLTTRLSKKHKHLRSQLLHIRLRVVTILKKWLELFYSDFSADPALLKDLEAFEKLMSGLGGKSLHWQAILRISRAKAQLKQDKVKRAALKREAPKPLVPRQLQSPSLLDFHPLEVARQLALIDWELFAAIPHQEFIAKAWDSPALSPVSQKWINHYEQGINWVATEIVMTPNPKQRAIVIQRFIEIAECCLSLNNFNGTIQIISALGTHFVVRLKTAWKGVPPKYTAKLRALEELVIPADGYARLKVYMAELSPPLVPYHQLLHHDLSAIDDRNASFVSLAHSSGAIASRDAKRRGGGGGSGSEKVRKDSGEEASGQGGQGRKNSKKAEATGDGGLSGSGSSIGAAASSAEPQGGTTTSALSLSSSALALGGSGSGIGGGKAVSARSNSGGGGAAGAAAVWVNFEKMALMGHALLEIATLQSTPLQLEEVAVIRQYLVSPPVVLSDRNLGLRSRSCEPAQESPIYAVRRRNSKDKDKLREDSKRIRQSSIRGVGLSLSAAVKKTFTDKKKTG
ncbi:RasGEF domain containing protein [Acanthamoeba castellanii str. Neff]|uniref:RasGEF domain containing protein n=1 Tax=Acanthamoeba castellanii (strain ATCC 30010 / Neff) TaxID=1257118 RepID=L8H701_ACACF|nr:RasGEF domain containing protein [Acanthamoeba castellanii str. Neff]ELR20503.1 RasGEF domain containing protein [Acanthamoeba castellanii str. Neff]